MAMPVSTGVTTETVFVLAQLPLESEMRTVRVYVPAFVNVTVV